MSIFAMDFIGTDKCILYDLYIHCTVFTPHLFLTAIAPPSLTAVIYFRVQGMVQGYVYPSAEAKSRKYQGVFEVNKLSFTFADTG